MTIIAKRSRCATSSLPSWPVRSRSAANAPDSNEKLGDLSISLGEPRAAREHYQQALALRREIAAQNRDETQAQRDVLLSLQKVGNHELIYSLDPKTARQHYQEALDGFLERLQAEPASVLAKMDVALAHYYVATADLRGGPRLCDGPLPRVPRHPR